MVNHTLFGHVKCPREAPDTACKKKLRVLLHMIFKIYTPSNVCNPLAGYLELSSDRGASNFTQVSPSGNTVKSRP